MQKYFLYYKSFSHWEFSFLFSLQAEINQAFDVTCSSCLYHCFLVSYLLGLIILLYYLADNMFSKSRLSPRRIKAWYAGVVVFTRFIGYSTVMKYVALGVLSGLSCGIHIFVFALLKYAYRSLAYHDTYFHSFFGDTFLGD